MKNKKILFAVLICMLAMLFTGCDVTPLTRKEVKQFVARELGHSDFKLSRASKETSKSKHTWNVYDEKNDIHFHVFDDYYASGDTIPTFGRDVYTDYQNILIDRYKEYIPESVEYLEDDDRDKRFLIVYTELDDLKKSCDDLWDFFDKLNSVYVNCEIPYEINYDYTEIQRKYPYISVDYDDSMATGAIGMDREYDRYGVLSAQEMYDEAVENLFCLGCEYQFPEITNKMSPDDKKNTIENMNGYVVGISKEGENVDYNSGAIAVNSSEISYGNLYVLLDYLGAKVEGSPTDFKYTDDEGNVYEFSYNLIDEQKNICYLKNGENVYPEEGETYYCEPLLNRDEVSKITGTNIEIISTNDFFKVDENRSYNFVDYVDCNIISEKIPHQRDLKKYLKNNCSEDVELIGYQFIYHNPDNVVYSFKTRNRGIVFQVSRMLTYEKNKKVIKYESDYVDRVRDLYREDILNEFNQFEYSAFNKGIAIRNVEEVDAVVDAVKRANAIYRKELKFNSSEFLKDNSFGKVNLYGCAEDFIADEYSAIILSINIDGTDTNAKKLKDEIKTEMAQMIIDESLSSKAYDGLEDKLSVLHKTDLYDVYLNDEQISDENSSLSPTNRYKYPSFNRKTQQYMMTIDFSKESGYNGIIPLNVQDYMDKLGGSFEVLTFEENKQGSDEKVRWSYNESEWIMTFQYDDEAINSVIVTKDGKELALDVQKGFQYHEVCFSVDDFCKLFDCTYTIDEEEGSIYFYTK